MNTFIVGGTGFVGVNLARGLKERGHRVTVMGQSSRRPPGLDSDVEIVAGDARFPGEWQERVSDSSLVINLAGASIFSRWTASYKKLLRDSRILTTRNIVDALPADSGGRALFSTSAVGYYGFRDDEMLNEDSSPGDDFLARLSVDWEKEALRAGERSCRVVITRFGIVLGRNGGALGQMLPVFRFFLGGPLGDGRQWFSWIHMDDLIAAFLFLLDRPGAAGPYNLTAPEPVRNRDLAKTLGRLLHRPSFVPAPSFMIRLVLGEFGNVVLKGQRVLPEQLSRDGFSFSHPRLEGALRSVL